MRSAINQPLTYARVGTDNTGNTVPLLGQGSDAAQFRYRAGGCRQLRRLARTSTRPSGCRSRGSCVGTRWSATSAGPAYYVLYEVEQLAALASEAYLARLNLPLQWTQKMMPHYRGMSRGSVPGVVRSCGLRLGPLCAAASLQTRAGRRGSLLQWLGDELMPVLCMRPGLGSVHLLQRRTDRDDDDQTAHSWRRRRR